MKSRRISFHFIEFRTLITAMLLMWAGCSVSESTTPKSGSTSTSDRQQSADLHALFVGNSHTLFHEIPDLVGRMIEFVDPPRKVATMQAFCGFLEETAIDPAYKRIIESRPWDFVVLQAQKISMSGRFEYSTQEGIDVAKLAKSRGATVYYFSEWGRKGVAEETERTHKIYEQMAQAAEVNVAPVGRAWEMALLNRPDLKLHSQDGNHETEIGAFLTACVLCGQLTGKSPTPLASFDYPAVSAKDRKFLAEIAASALK